MSSSTPNPDTSSQTEDVNISYKDKLDQAAHKARQSKTSNTDDKNNDVGVVNSVVEKVSQYVPAVGKMLGKEETKEESAPAAGTATDTPPKRPHHDTQIEEFVRDQHRSRPGEELQDQV